MSLLQRSCSCAETLAKPYPGRSTKSTLSVGKKLIVVVLPGLAETFTRPLRLKSLFISEDLPTLERPAKDTSGLTQGGSCEGVPYAPANLTCW